LNWYALYTKPHVERQVNQVLESRGLETFLPTIPVWRARRRRFEAEPLFACYLFARLDLEQLGLSAVAWTPGLRRLVGGETEAPTPVPEEVINYIRRRIEGVTAQDGLVVFKSGEPVDITAGPFKDLEAIFDSHLSGAERAQVLIKVLGRLTRYEVPLEWLKKR
jgi:transcriptional antiterminator RfaH